MPYTAYMHVHYFPNAKVLFLENTLDGVYNLTAAKKQSLVWQAVCDTCGSLNTGTCQKFTIDIMPVKAQFA